MPETKIRKSRRLLPNVSKAGRLQGYTPFVSLMPYRDGDIDRLLLGCFTVCATTPTGLLIEQVDAGHFETAYEFWHLLAEYLPARVVAYDWEHAASMLRTAELDMMDSAGYDIKPTRSILTPARGGRAGPFKVHLDWPGKGNGADLVSLTNYWQSDLPAIAASVQIPMLDKPSLDQTSTIIDYLNRNIEIMEAAWFRVHQESQHTAGVTPGVTMASTSLRQFKGRDLPRHKDVKIQGNLEFPTTHQAEVASYAGGRTDVFATQATIAKAPWIYKYDMNGMYPYIMRGALPVCYLQEGNLDWVRQLPFKPMPDTICLAQVSLNIPTDRYGMLGLAGIKDDRHGLFFPAGRIRKVWLWEPELVIANENDWIENVHESILYDAQAVTKEYQEYLYDRRYELRTAGDIAGEDLIKMSANSLYGKFGAKEYQNWVEVKPGTDEYLVHWRGDSSLKIRADFYSPDPNQDETPKLYWEIRDRLYTQFDDWDTREVSQDAVLSIAAYITSMGRALIHRTMQAIIDRGGMPVYCDTDSVWATCELPPALVHPTKSGKYKLEGKQPGSQVMIPSPKQYLFGDELKSKGIKNPTSLFGPQTQEQRSKFSTSLTSRDPARQLELEAGGAVIRTVTKEPTGGNRKRIELDNHPWLLPIVLP